MLEIEFLGPTPGTPLNVSRTLMPFVSKIMDANQYYIYVFLRRFSKKIPPLP